MTKLFATGEIREKLVQLILYSIPNLLSKGISFFLVPLYVTFFSIQDFARLELLIVLSSFFQYVFHFGWGSAYLRIGSDDSVNFNNLTRTMLIFRIAVSFIVALILLTFGGANLSNFLVNDDSLISLIYVVLLTYVFKEISLFWETKYRLENKASLFAIYNSLSALIQLMSILALVLYFEFGIKGVVWGQFIAVSLTLFAFILIDGSWLLKGSLDATIFKRAMRYGLPLAPTAISMFTILSLDRLMLAKLVDSASALEQVGSFALAYKFVAILTLLTTGFSIFWSPFVFQNYKYSNSKYKFAWVFRNYIAALSFLIILIIVCVPFLFTYIDSAYQNGLILVPILLSGFLMYQIGDYFCVGIDIKERTSIRMKLSIISAITNLILNFALIPKFGALGAALATVVCQGVYVLPLMIISNRLYSVPYPITFWLILVLLIFFSAFFISGSFLSLIFYLTFVILIGYVAYLYNGGYAANKE